MKVILQHDVPNLGDAGEIKEVANGYARNYLLPRKLVIPASEGSTKSLEHQKRLMNSRIEKRTKEMQVIANDLKNIGSVEVKVRVGAKNRLFGSVTTMQISNALKDKGFNIEKRKIEIEGSIKALGTFKCKVKLAEKIIVPLQLNVTADEKEIDHEAIYAEELLAKEKEAAKNKTEETTDPDATQAPDQNVASSDAPPAGE